MGDAVLPAGDSRITNSGSAISGCLAAGAQHQGVIAIRGIAVTNDRAIGTTGDGIVITHNIVVIGGDAVIAFAYHQIFVSGKAGVLVAVDKIAITQEDVVAAVDTIVVAAHSSVVAATKDIVVGPCVDIARTDHDRVATRCAIDPDRH